MSDRDKIKATIDHLISYGSIDGGHHKMWTIDQALRILLEDEYEPVIQAYKLGSEYDSELIHLDNQGDIPIKDIPEDELENLDMYFWDEGIAP